MIVDVVDHNQRISACGRQRWRDAMHLLQALQPKLRASIITFNAAVAAFSRENWQRALDLHKQMLQMSAKQDVITVNTSGQALQADQWQAVFNLMETALRANVRLSQTSFGIVINSCKGSEKWGLAIGALSQIQKTALQSNEIVWSSLVHACVVWETALAIMEAALKSARPNLVCFSSLSSTLDRKATWERSLSLVDAVLGRHVQLGNSFLHNTACSSCARVACWESAVEVQVDIVKHRLQLDVVGFTAAMSAVDAPSWRHILVLLKTVYNSGIELNSLAFNAAGDGLATSRHWDSAFSLLEVMHTLRMEMDVFTCSLVWTGYRLSGRLATGFLLQSLQSDLKPNRVLLSSAITLCKECYQWTSALDILSSMRTANAQPDLISHSDAIGACCVPCWQVAFDLWLQMPAQLAETDVACTAQVLESAVEQQSSCAPELADKLDACATLQYAASRA
eukprot:s1633_g1.t1